LISDSKFKEFAAGFLSPLRALALLPDHPKLFGLFVLPMLITVSVVAVAIYGILIGTWSAVQGILLTWLGSSFSGIASGVVAALAALMLAYFAILFLNLLIEFVASPFNDFLSEAVEGAVKTSSRDTPSAPMVSVIWLDFRKTILISALTLLLLVLSLIPLGQIAVIPALALLRTLTFITYPQNRRGHGIFESVGWIGANFPRALGFGLASLILFSTPVINLFALPLSVIAGTLVYLKK
jgi:CysZ protein